MYSVYIHTFPNGKRYVGITSLTPESRWGSNGNNAMHSKESRLKASAKLKGRKPSEYSILMANKAKFKPVENLLTGKVYDSIKEACEDTGVCKSTIKKQTWRYYKKINAEVLR